MKALYCIGFAFLLATSGCASWLNHETGTAISDEQLQSITPNKTTKTEIFAKFGTPSRIMQSGDDQLIIYDHQILKSFGSNVNESVTFILNKKDVVTNVTKGKGSGSSTGNALLDAAARQ